MRFLSLVDSNLVCIYLILFKWCFGLPLTEERTFSVIYNSLRYDDNTNVVTFHLREKDWNELKSHSRMWISSSDMIPTIERETIFLGDESVVSVGRVDPVQEFGLFSVQTFTEVESTEDSCEILEVSLG